VGGQRAVLTKRRGGRSPADRPCGPSVLGGVGPSSQGERPAFVRDSKKECSTHNTHLLLRFISSTNAGLETILPSFSPGLELQGTSTGGFLLGGVISFFLNLRRWFRLTFREEREKNLLRKAGLTQVLPSSGSNFLSAKPAPPTPKPAPPKNHPPPGQSSRKKSEQTKNTGGYSSSSFKNP